MRDNSNHNSNRNSLTTIIVLILQLSTERVTKGLGFCDLSLKLRPKGLRLRMWAFRLGKYKQ